MKRDLQYSYGIACDQLTPVTGGWMNKKWRTSSARGDVLIKQYSHRRFDKNKLEAIEAALQRQMLLERDGIPCPRIWQYEGRAIRLLGDEISYLVMDFHPGEIERPDTVTIAQMQSLGDTCGAMHRAFGKIPPRPVKGYPLHGAGVIEALWANYNNRIRECPTDELTPYQEAVLAQKPILEKLTNTFFDRLPKGIAHEDFTPDNMLFFEDRVSSILDFDRNQYSYLWHDVGRAILSFTLEDNQINIEKTNAFMKGYSRHSALTLHDIADALRLCWCIEIPWWIQAGYFGSVSEKVARFQYEMAWLTENWFQIDSLLCAEAAAH